MSSSESTPPSRKSEFSADETTEPVARSFDDSLRGRLDGLKVLVVEDAPDSLALFTHMLTLAGAAVSQAESANVAWNSLAVDRPDIIVSDIAMPDEDGIAFIKELRTQERGSEAGSIPAVAVTAFTDRSVRSLALVSGFQDCLTKPVSAKGLIHTILSLVSPPNSQVH